ncbi:MAG: hypothetical protein M0T75_00600 [Chloroflexi bacterium]|nr:hypothetical protein [Chloroflexota bacterium]
MRRIFAVATALVLVLGLAGPAGAYDGGPQIAYVTIGTATVDRSGNVHIQGTLWCSQPMDVQIQWGQVEQVVGRTTTVRGGFGGWYPCNGTTPWESWARAENGKFVPGWATISVQFEGAYWCDEDPNVNPNTYCGPHAWGGGQQYLKIGRAK